MNLELPSRMKALREKLALTQEQLGQCLSLSKMMIYGVETGRKRLGKAALILFEQLEGSSVHSRESQSSFPIKGKTSPKPKNAVSGAKKSVPAKKAQGERKIAPPWQLAIHPLYGSLPVTARVVSRLQEEAERAKGGQFADKQEMLDDNAESWTAFVGDTALLPTPS